MKPLLDARDLQAEFGLSRRLAYRVLHEGGRRIGPRRLLILRERALEYLRGEVIGETTRAADDEGSRPRLAIREP